MSKQREAMKQALHALQTKGEHHRFVYDAMKALAEALAEPEPWTPDDMAYRPGGLSMSAEQEQEPVAWMLMNDTHCHIMATEWKPEDSDGWKTVPLYAAPPARKPLTDEHISAIVQSMSAYTWDVYMLARAIERAHGITE